MHGDHISRGRVTRAAREEKIRRGASPHFVITKNFFPGVHILNFWNSVEFVQS